MSPTKRKRGPLPRVRTERKQSQRSVQHTKKNRKTRKSVGTLVPHEKQVDVSLAIENSEQSQLQNKMQTYINYTNELREKLMHTKSLFSVHLQPMKQKEFDLDSKVAFEFAEKYYHDHSYEPPSPYVLSSKKDTSIEYSARNDAGQPSRIAKGTFNLKNNPEIVNFYQVRTSYNTTTYRFGTPVYSFHDIETIVQNLQMFQPTKNKLINISLLSPCNSVACTQLAVAAQPLSKVSKLFEKGLSATKEDDIIQKELGASNLMKNGMLYFGILFPLSSQTYTGVGSKYLPKLQTYKYDKESLKAIIKDEKVRQLYDFIDVNDDENGRKAYASIVKLAMYYFLFLKDEYILSYHCKSGKDRTSVFDAIVQATFYYLQTPNQKHRIRTLEDIYDLRKSVLEEIRTFTQSFLMYGFLIAFYSTGVTGLKLKNITIAKHIFHDKKRLFKLFLGHSSMVSS